MNKRILLALCLIAASLQGLLAQSYVLNDNTSWKFKKNTSKTYTLSCPGKTLSFDIYLPGSCTGTLTIKDDNGNQIYSQNLYSIANLFSGKTVSITSLFINQAAKQIIFSIGEGTLEKTVSNVKVTRLTYVESTVNPIICGALEVLQSSTDTKFSVNWCDVEPMTLTLDNTTDFALSTTSIESSTCAYGTESDIIIDFHPQTKGDKTATVTISDADNKVWGTVTITGHGDGLPQTISWWDPDVTMLSRGDTIGSNESPFVQASSGLALTTLTSSDENVLKIEGGKLIAVAAGTATITAYQAGTSTISEATATLTIEVTNLLTQRITWAQGLNFKWGDAATSLTATSSSGLPITYELVDNANNVVTLVGNTVNISTSKAGTATIKAVQAGDATYAATSYLRTLRVRDPNASCLNEPFGVDDPNRYTQNGVSSGIIHTYNIVGPPDMLYFNAMVNRILGFNQNCDFTIQQYINGSWTDVKTITANSTDTQYSCKLNKDAKQVRFNISYHTAKRFVSNVQVTRAHFIESEPTSITIDGQFETTTKKTVKVTYSNIQDVVDVKMASNNAEFSVSPSSFAGNDCGEYGTISLLLSYTPETMDSDKDTIIVSNTKDGEIRIPISTTVQKRAQYISWALRDSLSSTQTYTLNKVNPVSSLPITYTFSDESILKLDANNKLVFLQVDTVVTITATCAGNENYLDAEPIIKTIRIFKGLPVLTLPTAGDTIYFGQKLGLIPLIGGCAKDLSGDTIKGAFRWRNYLEVPNAGNPVLCAVTFIPENSAVYGDVSDFIPVIILKLPQTLEWTMPDSIGILDSITLDARVPSGLKISYSLTGDGTSYASIGANNELKLTATTAALGKSLTITAWQVGNHNYLPSDTVSYTVVIRKTIADFFAATEPTEYGKRLNDIVVYVDHNVSGTWSYDDTSNPTLDACHYNLSATFTPTNLDLCDRSHVEIPVNITAIPTTINTIPTASALVEGQSLAQANLTGGSASVAGTFMWKKTTMVPPVGENQEFDVIFTPDSKNYATATCKVTVTVTAKP
ncbi:MAG: hypothetical protein PHI42_05340 [Paludibacteraceae bacterium]|nr:hypothetical protein [Paludibacteraceae bacterium]